MILLHFSLYIFFKCYIFSLFSLYFLYIVSLFSLYFSHFQYIFIYFSKSFLFSHILSRILSKSLVSSAHLAYYVGYEIQKREQELILPDLQKEVDFHWDSIEFELILTLSLKYQHDLNSFTIFDDHNVEEIRLFYYLFKNFAYQEKLDNLQTFPEEMLNKIPYLSFRNYKDSAVMPISFIQDFSMNNSKFIDGTPFKLSDDSLEKYKYFLRINPRPGVFLNNLLMKHVNKKFVKVLESLQRVYMELLAENLYFCNYKLFAFYLKHLRTMESLSNNSLRSLFEIVLDILEEQETFEVFYRGNRFVPTDKILNKLRILANLQDSKGLLNNKRNIEVQEFDDENLLLRGKIIEALLANGEMGYLGLLNELEEKFVFERNRRTALPIAFQKMRTAGMYLEKNRNK